MLAATFQSIRVERQGPVCSIYLNKPPLNIIDLAMIQELRTALTEIESENEIRIVVIRGAGEKGFSAGVSVQDHTPDRIPEMIPAFDEIFHLLAKTEKVTVAAVHGFCLGGGFEVILACDLVLAAEGTQFGQPEIKLGQLAPVGLILLPHLVGYRKAAELLFTGASIGAAEAQSLGLINRVVPAGDLQPALDKLLSDLSAQSGTILRLTKRALRRTSVLNFDAALDETEKFFFDEVATAPDAKEGIFAFLEKRPPKWTHE